MSFCTKCGKENKNEARFCQNCGSTVTQTLSSKENTKTNSKGFTVRGCGCLIFIFVLLLSALLLLVSIIKGDDNKPSNEAMAAPASATSEPAPTASDVADTFNDPRDGKTYKTTKIGEQIWMAENLNYDAEGSKCYNNGAHYCQKFGRLYDWETAKNACPKGWHLPTNAEWDKLCRHADGTNGTDSPYKSQTAGKYLKATSGWKDGGNGTDAYGFAALPGGNGTSAGLFMSVGSNGNYWSASDSNPDWGDTSRAYGRIMVYGFETAYFVGNLKRNLFSVRCLRD